MLEERGFIVDYKFMAALKFKEVKMKKLTEPLKRLAEVARKNPNSGAFINNRLELGQIDPWREHLKKGGFENFVDFYDFVTSNSDSILIPILNRTEELWPISK